MSSDFINHLLSYTCGLTVKVLESLTQTPSSHRTKGFFWICHNRTVFDSIKNWQIMSVRLCKNLIKWYVISYFLYTYFIQREKAHKHSKHKLSLPVCVSVCVGLTQTSDSAMMFTASSLGAELTVIKNNRVISGLSLIPDIRGRLLFPHRNRPR